MWKATGNLQRNAWKIIMTIKKQEQLSKTKTQKTTMAVQQNNKISVKWEKAINREMQRPLKVW